MQRQIVAALSAIALLSLAFPAAARDVRSSDTMSVAVSHADLNLDNVAGATTMLRRIDGAARRACGGAPFAREIGAMRDYHLCVRAASERAIAELGRPVVTAEFIARRGVVAQAPVVSASSR